MKILVLDDEINFTFLMETVLSKEGHTVSIAHTVSQALSMIASFEYEFDWAILDLRLGNTSGLTVLLDIKKRALKTKIIIVTGYWVKDNITMCEQAGADYCMLKPLNINELKRVIKGELTNPRRFFEENK